MVDEGRQVNNQAIVQVEWVSKSVKVPVFIP